MHCRHFLIIIIIIIIIITITIIYGEIQYVLTECAVEEEKHRFWQGKGDTDQVFVVRQVCVKYLANGKDVFWACIDFEKAYDTISSPGML